jgi:hypothetical protein
LVMKDCGTARPVVLTEILLFISLYFFVFEPEFVGINSNSNASGTLRLQPQGLEINIRE